MTFDNLFEPSDEYISWWLSHKEFRDWWRNLRPRGIVRGCARKKLCKNNSELGRGAGRKRRRGCDVSPLSISANWYSLTNGSVASISTTYTQKLLELMFLLRRIRESGDGVWDRGFVRGAKKCFVSSVASFRKFKGKLPRVYNVL